MTRRTAAIRAARALFEVSVQQSDPQRVERELRAFAGLLREHAALGHALRSPGVPAPRKRALVAELVVRAGYDQVVGKFLLLLAERDRFADLEDVVDTYHARLMQHQGIVEARVTTAAPLPADRAAALAQGLSRATGKRVSVVTDVDQAIVGGVVAKVGSVVYDGSVVRQLERIRHSLEQAG